MYYSYNITVYDKWTLNETYGGEIQGLTDDHIDFAMSTMVFAPERLHLYSPIDQICTMR